LAALPNGRRQNSRLFLGRSPSAEKKYRRRFPVIVPPVFLDKAESFIHSRRYGGDLERTSLSFSRPEAIPPACLFTFLQLHRSLSQLFTHEFLDSR